MLVTYIAVTRYVVDIPPIHTDYQFKGLCKILLVTALLTGMVSDYRRLKIFFIVIAFSASFWAIKGGIKILLLGPHQVYGKSYDNNLFALISVMSLPLVFYGAALVKKTKWRPVFLICAGLICLGIIGSRSRAGIRSVCGGLVHDGMGKSLSSPRSGRCINRCVDCNYISWPRNYRAHRFDRRLP